MKTGWPPLAVLLWCLSCGQSNQREDTGSPVDSPLYLTVHVAVPHHTEVDRFRQALLREVDALRTAVGKGRPSAGRVVGFSPDLLPTLNLSRERLRQAIEASLDVAEQTGMPVLFHLDDMHFLWNLPALWQDPYSVEWSGFPRPGQSTGKLVPRYAWNWGQWIVSPASPPCFDAPTLRGEMATRLSEDVAAPIVARLARWRASGQEYLFAGIVMGNETQVPNLVGLSDLLAIGPVIALPADELFEGRVPTMIELRKADAVPSGYHALHRRGYDATRLIEEASRNGRNVHDLTAHLLYQVAHDCAEHNTRVLVQAGLSKERVFTHFTSTFRSHVQEHGQTNPLFGTAGSSSVPPPYATAITDWSIPGFTVSRDALDLAEVRRQLSTAAGGPVRWAVVESYIFSSQGDAACSTPPCAAEPMSQGEYTAHLAQLFGAGARLINVYAWRDGGFYRPANGVVTAIRIWSNGGQ